MIDFDFLPPEYHRERVEQSRLRRYAVLGGVLLATMAGWMLMHGRAMRHGRADLAEIQRQRSQIAIHRAMLESLEVQRGGLLERHRLESELDDSASFAVLLGAVSRCVPPAVCLTDWRYFAAAPPDGATPPPNPAVNGVPSSPERPVDQTALRAGQPTLLIRGVAADKTRISDFAAALAGVPYFADVTTEAGSERVVADRVGVGFEIACRALRQRGGPK